MPWEKRLKDWGQAAGAARGVGRSGEGEMMTCLWKIACFLGRIAFWVSASVFVLLWIGIVVLVVSKLHWILGVMMLIVLTGMLIDMIKTARGIR